MNGKKSSIKSLPKMDLPKIPESLPGFTSVIDRDTFRNHIEANGLQIFGPVLSDGCIVSVAADVENYRRKTKFGFLERQMRLQLPDSVSTAISLAGIIGMAVGLVIGFLFAFSFSPYWILLALFSLIRIIFALMVDEEKLNILGGKFAYQCLMLPIYTIFESLWVGLQWLFWRSAKHSASELLWGTGVTNGTVYVRLPVVSDLDGVIDGWRKQGYSVHYCCRENEYRISLEKTGLAGEPFCVYPDPKIVVFSGDQVYQIN